jgi:hypothetical protein
MIENYGTINRDLDKLLLISAESEDVDEKIIALEHMIERIEVFAESTLFYSCIEAAISSEKPKHRILLINLLSKYFNILPLRIIDKSMLLLADSETEIQKKYLKIYSDNISTINKFKTNPEFETGILVEKLQLAAILSEYLDQKEIDAELVNKFLQITLSEFEIMFKNNLMFGYNLTLFAYEDRYGKQINRNLTLKQIHNIKNIEKYVFRELGEFLPIYNDTRWGTFE